MWIAIGSKRINLDHVAMVELDYAEGTNASEIALVVAHPYRDRIAGEVRPVVTFQGGEAEALRLFFDDSLWTGNYEGMHCRRVAVPVAPTPAPAPERSEAIALRDKVIREMADRGVSLRDLAACTGLSSSRVLAILGPPQLSERQRREIATKFGDVGLNWLRAIGQPPADDPQPGPPSPSKT